MQEEAEGLGGKQEEAEGLGGKQEEEEWEVAGLWKMMH